MSTREVSEAMESAAEEWSDKESQEAVEGAEAPDQPDTEGAEETEEESEETPEEVPTEYFGTDLSHIEDAAVRKEVISALEEQNRAVNRRLQEIAEERKAVEAERKPVVQETPEVKEPEVDDILREMGLDTSHPYFEELRPFLEPLALQTWEARQQVETSTAAQRELEWARGFQSDLTTLEETHGKLPYERADVLALADEHQLYEPKALYWSIMGPIKEKAYQETVSRASKAEEQTRTLKKTVAGPRPRASAKGTTEPPKARTLADILAQAEEAAGRSIISE